LIDDQVHFREPGLTHKAEIIPKQKQLLRRVTSYMEMPNTNPQAVTVNELEKKYKRASEVHWQIFLFYGDYQ